MTATEAHKTLKYLNLEEKRQIHEAVFSHKALTGKTPSSITSEYLKLLSHEDNRSALRGNLKIPHHKKSLFERGVLYRTVKMWNSTDPNIRTDDTTSFKVKLQKTMQNEKYNC